MPLGYLCTMMPLGYLCTLMPAGSPMPLMPARMPAGSPVCVWTPAGLTVCTDACSVTSVTEYVVT